MRVEAEKSYLVGRSETRPNQLIRETGGLRPAPTEQELTRNTIEYLKKGRRLIKEEELLEKTSAEISDSEAGLDPKQLRTCSWDTRCCYADENISRSGTPLCF